MARPSGPQKGRNRSFKGVCLVLVALHEERLIRGRLGARHVLALVGLGVGLRACLQLVLGGLQVLRLSLPRLEGGLLEGAAVREGERPEDRQRMPGREGGGARFETNVDLTGNVDKKKKKSEL